MAFSGGTYTLPGAALNTGDTVSATENNTFRNDVATAFNLTWLRNGTAAATADIPMGGYSFTNCAAVGSNGSLLLKVNNGTTAATLDTSGNLGLGVTPSAWYTTYGLKAFQFAASGSLHGLDVSSTDRRVALSNNAYINTSGSDIYTNTGAATKFQQVNGQHQWYNAPSGTAGTTATFTQAMTLDASGNLLVGRTTAPASATNVISVGGTATAPTDDNAAFFNGSGVGPTISGYQFAVKTGNGSTSERMRIDSSGNLLVGRTSLLGSEKFNVTGGGSDWVGYFYSNNSTSYYGVRVNTAVAQNNTGSLLYDGLEGGTLRFRVYSNGGIANYTANNSPLSDRRLKKDIQPAGSYLQKICAIPVVTYLYKDQTDELPNLGVIAQDVQAAAPELCNEEGWGTKAEDGTNYLGIWETDIQYALMKCIQEQQAIITQLQADVAALKGRP